MYQDQQCWAVAKYLGITSRKKNQKMIRHMLSVTRQVLTWKPQWNVSGKHLLQGPPDRHEEDEPYLSLTQREIGSAPTTLPQSDYIKYMSIMSIYINNVH